MFRGFVLDNRGQPFPPGEDSLIISFVNSRQIVPVNNFDVTWFIKGY
jgi:hypothetical protein